MEKAEYGDAFEDDLLKEDGCGEGMTVDEKANGVLCVDADEELIFPLQDTDVMDMVLKMQETGAAPPSIVKKVAPFKGTSDPYKVLPMPPVPHNIEELGIDLLEGDDIGRMFAVYQAIMVLGEFLNLAPFGLSAFVESVAFRPASLTQRRDDTVSFASPLYQEVVTRLIVFLLERPEYEPICKQVFEQHMFPLELFTGGESQPVRNLLALVSSATWQALFVDLVVLVDQAATSQELGLSAAGAGGSVDLDEVFGSDSVEELLAKYPQTLESYALEECKKVVQILMDDPSAAPFKSKVDPEQLGVPEYFDKIPNPMDLGTVMDRLYSGYYSLERVEILLKQVQAQVEDMRTLADSLCDPLWTLENFCAVVVCLDARVRNRGIVEEGLGGLQGKNSDLLVQYKQLCKRLQTAVEGRREEALRRGTLVRELAVKPDEGTPLDRIVGAQGLALTETKIEVTSFTSLGLQFAEHAIPIRIVTAGAGGSHDFVVENVPCPFFARVGKVSTGRGMQAAKFADQVQVGDVLVAIGETKMQNLSLKGIKDWMATRTPADFPLVLRFARPAENPLDFAREALEVIADAAALAPAEEPSPSADQDRGDEEENTVVKQDGDSAEEPDDEQLDGNAGGLNAFFADVHLVFQNCYRFNTKKAPISRHALLLEEKFDQLYHARIVGLVERIENAQYQATSGPLDPVFDLIDSAQQKDVIDIDPAQRIAIAYWLLEKVLICNDIITFFDTGALAPTLVRKTSRAQVRSPMTTLVNGGPPAIAPYGAKEYSDATHMLDRGESDEFPGFFDVDCGALLRLEPLGVDRFATRYWWFDGDVRGRVFCEYVVDEKSTPRGRKPRQDLNLEEQARLVRQRAKLVFEDGEAETMWGVLTTVEELNKLVDALSPFSRGELELLKNLWVLFVRIATRMITFGANEPEQYHEKSKVFTPFVVPSVPVNEELEAKVAFGVEVAAFAKPFKRKHMTSRKHFPVKPESLAPFRQKHTEYRNPSGDKTDLELVQTVLGSSEAQDPVMTRILATLHSSSPDFGVARTALVRVLRNLEARLWRARGDTRVMGPAWRWPVTRHDWLVELKALEYSYDVAFDGASATKQAHWMLSRKGSQASAKARRRGGRSSEVAKLAVLVLQLERDCISFFGRGTSCAANAVSLKWRAHRSEWIRRVEQAATLPELTLLSCTLVRSAVHWSYFDVAVAKLYRQHPALGLEPSLLRKFELSSLESDESDVILKEPLHDILLRDEADPEATRRGTSDVSFGQLISQHEALEALGFVALGAFLGTFLHAAYFKREHAFVTQLPRAHVEAAERIAAFALNRAGKAAKGGDTGVNMALMSTRPEILNKPKRLRSMGLPPGFTLERLKQIFVQVMVALALKQKHVSAQLGCSQSHLSLWLNDRDGLDRTKFNPKIINWLRVKNQRYTWVQAADIKDADGNAITNLEDNMLPLMEVEDFDHSPPPDKHDHLREVLMPLIRAVCLPATILSADNASDAKNAGLGLPSMSLLGAQSGAGAPASAPSSVPTSNNSSPAPAAAAAGSSAVGGAVGFAGCQFADVTADQPQHPYSMHLRRSLRLKWDDVIPYRASVAEPRRASPILDFSSWLNYFSASIRHKLLASGLAQFAPGTQVVYFPEGHAFANAHGELRMASEVNRGGRASVLGPGIPSVLKSRKPILCRVQGISFQAAHNLPYTPLPYCTMELVPDSQAGNFRVPFLETGIPIGAGKPFRTMRDILLPISSHLVDMSETQACMNTLSPEIYRDLPHERPIVGLWGIHERVLEGKYEEVGDFIADLETMAHQFRGYCAETHHFDSQPAEAATLALVRAKLLVRHPETLCTLAEQTPIQDALRGGADVQAVTAAAMAAAGGSPPDAQVFPVVLRPQYETSAPFFVVALADLVNATSKQAGWKIGARVRRRGASANTAKHHGTVVGFRHVLPDLQLPWASVVVRWDTTLDANECDATFDFPEYAHAHANPWEVIVLGD